MSAFEATADSAYRTQLAGHEAAGVISKRIIVGYGFWIFLLSDIVML
jgi:hypothetical protein